MYGLKEAGVIAFGQLIRYIVPHGYKPAPCTPGLCNHTTRPTTFTLCVEDLGVNFFSKEDAHHLVNALKTNYEVTTDCTGSLYCGLTLYWHYAEDSVDISMPGYVIRALQKFGHTKPKLPQNAPHKWIEPVYGLIQQHQPTTKSTTEPLDPKVITHVQSINVTFIFYSQFDPCIPVALNEIGSKQSKATTDTMEKANWLMDYLHTYLNAAFRFHVSNMILNISSDTAYLMQHKACSRIAVHYRLGWINEPDCVNRPVNIICQTLKNIVGSATES